jgi:prophage maintenance system killer protein
MDNFEKIRQLLMLRADLQSRIRLIPFDGSVEVKPRGNEKFIYVRKRIAGKNTSVFIDKYSEELFALMTRQALELRGLKKDVRKTEKELALLGHVDGDLSADVLLNIDFARANIKSLIYDQAVLEGVGTTFPQTESILENGNVNGVKASDVQKILNLKRAWEFILDKDVVLAKTDFYLLSTIARLINEGFYYNGGQVRAVPVSIGGTNYTPPLPIESDVKDDINAIVATNKTPLDIGIDLCLFVMKSQVFIDGNKRAAIIFANQFLISHACGVLVVPEKHVEQFKKLLVAYYEGKKETEIKSFLKQKCLKSLR